MTLFCIIPHSCPFDPYDVSHQEGGVSKFLILFDKGGGVSNLLFSDKRVGGIQHILTCMTKSKNYAKMPIFFTAFFHFL